MRQSLGERIWGALLLVFCLSAESFARTPESPTPDRDPGRLHLRQGEELARTLTLVTGLSVSPLLGVSFLGAVRYFEAPAAERHRLAWYARPWFWGTGLSLALLFALNTTLGALVPGLKKPMDAVEEWENKFSALLASPVAAYEIVRVLAGGGGPATGGWTETAARGVAAAPEAAGLVEGLGLTLGILLGLLVYGVVFVAAHGLQVLILLSPSAELDGILRLFRVALVGTLLALARWNPWLGAVLATALTLAALLIGRYALRLLVFASTISADLLLGRRVRSTEPRLRAFGAGGLPGFPARARGRVRWRLGRLEFEGRSGLLSRRKRVDLGPAATLWIRTSPWLPALVSEDSSGKRTVLLKLPPRYRGLEEALARDWGLAGVHVGKAERLVRSLRELLGSVVSGS